MKYHFSTKYRKKLNFQKGSGYQFFSDYDIS